MSIIARPLPSVKVSPARRSARPFGQGILASAPHFVAIDRNVADEAWLVEDNARISADNAIFDRMAGESLAIDRMELGIAL